MLLPWPMTMEFTSPRTTAIGQIETSSSTCASPSTNAVSST